MPRARPLRGGERAGAFVSNLDPAHLAGTLKPLDPETTLLVVASKTFTTLANANSAKAWLLAALREPVAIARHLIALSTNAQAVEAFSIDPDNMFIFWEGVGGRAQSVNTTPLHRD